MGKAYQALVVRRDGKRTFKSAIETRTTDDLPVGDVLIRVHYSSINYKDCLSCQGHPAITRRFPHTPGIDAAGIVEASGDSRFDEGDAVIVFSHAMGMTIPGGFGQFVRVQADWVMPLPNTMPLEEAMAYGTAGYTAALSVEAILGAGVRPEESKAVVSGATGGLGGIAVGMLADLGFHVTALTGKVDEARDFLMNLGASEVRDRREVEDNTGRNILVPIWNAAIDVAGGNLLSTLIKATADNGVVIATGMVQDTAFATTVLPFILRGVRLIGINAESTSMDRRKAVWAAMATTRKPKNFADLYTVVRLTDLPEAVEGIASGAYLGRVVVDMR